MVIMPWFSLGLGTLWRHNFEHNGSQTDGSIIEHNGSV